MSGEKFPYTYVPNSLRKLLRGIPEKAVPERVSRTYLKSIGMKSSNDPSIVPVLKFINLLDQSGTPTDNYRRFRDKTQGPALLAGLIRSAYASLYSTYEDAQARNDEDLKNFFRANTKLGVRVVNYQVATFKAVCEFGDFAGAVRTESPAGPTASRLTSPTSPEIHINLQIHLPESKDPAVYDAIFQAMSKYLKW